MKLNKNVYDRAITTWKLGLKAVKELTYLVETSRDYWNTTEHGTALLQKSLNTKEQKLHDAFSFYCRELGLRRDTTKKALTEKQIKAMDKWILAEGEKLEKSGKLGKASETIINSMTYNYWNEII